jgi:hypothetical protein
MILLLHNDDPFVLFLHHYLKAKHHPALALSFSTLINATSLHHTSQATQLTVHHNKKQTRLTINKQTRVYHQLPMLHLALMHRFADNAKIYALEAWRASLHSILFQMPLCFNPIDATQLLYPANLPRNISYKAMQQGLPYTPKLLKQKDTYWLIHLIGNEAFVSKSYEGSLKQSALDPALLQACFNLAQALNQPVAACILQKTPEPTLCFWSTTPNFTHCAYDFATLSQAFINLLLCPHQTQHHKKEEVPPPLEPCNLGSLEPWINPRPRTQTYIPNQLRPKLH